MLCKLRYIRNIALSRGCYMFSWIWGSLILEILEVITSILIRLWFDLTLSHLYHGLGRNFLRFRGSRGRIRIEHGIFDNDVNLDWGPLILLKSITSCLRINCYHYLIMFLIIFLLLLTFFFCNAKYIIIFWLHHFN